MDVRDNAIHYPDVFSEKSWKKAEQTMKLSSTGISKHLRAMETTAIKAAAAIQASGGSPKAEAAKKAHIKAVAEARAGVDYWLLKNPGGNKLVRTWLKEYADALTKYQNSYKRFVDPSDPVREIDGHIRDLHVDGWVRIVPAG
jgi:hypothetical protein